MKKQAALDHFGSAQGVADALDISVSAVSQWDDTIPEGSAYKLQVVTGGVLRVDPRLYATRPRRGESSRRRA